MIIGPSGEHEVVYSPIGGQDFFLVSAEIVQRCRCASQIPQLGDGVVGSRQKKIVVGGRPRDGRNPTGVMRHRRFDDGTLLRAWIVNAHVTIAGTSRDEAI